MGCLHQTAGQLGMRLRAIGDPIGALKKDPSGPKTWAPVMKLLTDDFP